MIKEKKAQDAHAKKKEINFSEVDFHHHKKPSDPYDFINKKNQKIDINPGIIYKSTSQDAVFEPRIFELRAEAITGISQFISKPKAEDEEEEDDEFYDDNY